VKKNILAILCLAAVLLSAGCAGRGTGSAGIQRPEKAETAAQVETPAQEDAQEEAQEAAAQEEPVAEELTGLAAVKKSVDDAAMLCAVAYVGWHNPEGASIQDCLEAQGNPVVAKYPGILEIPAEQRVEYAGEDIYLIVPGSAVTKVVVQEYCPFDADGKEAVGEELYSAEGHEAILISCNVSDIMENIRITLSREGGEDFSFSPTISLRDGTVALPEDGVLDFTEYATE